MKTICFKVDANAAIGQGHIMRCLTIAKNICEKEQIDCIFFASDRDTVHFLEDSGLACICLGIDYRDYSIQTVAKVYEKLLEAGADLLVVDSYFVTGIFLEEMRKRIRTACFCCREEKIFVDLLINYNINFNNAFYKKYYNDGSTRLLLGSQYIPLRPEFGKKYKYRQDKPVRSILVLTGGSDRNGFIQNFIKRIQNVDGYENISFVCLIGRYSPYFETVLQECALLGLKNMHILQNTPFIADLMRKQDLVISAGGTTVYELCALGIPSVIFSVADNQVSEAVYLQQKGILPYVGHCGEKNFWENLFWHINEILKKPLLRKQISERMSGVADGKGTERIADALLDLIKEEDVL